MCWVFSQKRSPWEAIMIGIISEATALFTHTQKKRKEIENKASEV